MPEIDPRIASTRNARVRITGVPSPNQGMNGREAVVTRRMNGGTRFAITFDDGSRASINGRCLEFVGESKAPAKREVDLSRLGPLPDYAGPVQVTFKHEGEFDGRPFGRVTVTDTPTFVAWCAENGHEVHEVLGQVDAFLPMGSQPAGRVRYDIFRFEAHAIAKRYGVRVLEA